MVFCMWGVPKLESTLLMWMRPEIRAHIEELTEIAEHSYLSLHTALANHKVELLQIEKRHQAALEKLGLKHKVELFNVNTQHQAQVESTVLKHEAETSTLKTRIHDLEARFIKDSHNSHKPSSTDGFKKPLRTQSLRERSGLKPGGQPGHKGRYKLHSEKPDHTILHRPKTCIACKKPLRRSTVVRRETRQLWDITDGKLNIVSHQALTKRCKRCGHKNRASFPEEIKAFVSYGPKIRAHVVYFMVKQLIPFKRTSEIFRDLYSIHLSQGTLFLILSQASQASKSAENKIKNTLINSSIAHFDESGIKINGKIKWLHAATDGKTILYSVHDKRGVIAINDIGILPEFNGISVHDGMKAYFTYDCRHALCNVHHLRELTFVHEFEKEAWAEDMKSFLKKANFKVRDLKSRDRCLSDQEMSKLKVEYLSILESAYEFHGVASIPNLIDSDTDPPIQNKKREKQKTGKNLLDRLNRYQVEVLAFLGGVVPFSNNAAEQVIRVAKVKQRISGSFRSLGGAMIFYRLRSVVGSYQNYLELVYK